MLRFNEVIGVRVNTKEALATESQSSVDSIAILYFDCCRSKVQMGCFSCPSGVRSTRRGIRQGFRVIVFARNTETLSEFRDIFEFRYKITSKPAAIGPGTRLRPAFVSEPVNVGSWAEP